MKHAAHFIKFANVKAATKPLPYSIIMEANGGPDHNLIFFSNQISLFGIFLLLEIDSLKVFCGCSSLLYLNTTERAMPSINIQLSCLALKLAHNTDAWLHEDIIASCLIMKAARSAINQYDKEFLVAVQVLERCLATFDGEVTPLHHNEDLEAVCEVGDYVRKFFPSYGWFEGTVIAINPEAIKGRCNQIWYMDGNVKDVTNHEMKTIKEIAIIPIGEVRFLFVKKFEGNFFSGKVICIMQRSEQWLCWFNDKKEHQYTLQQLEKYSKLKGHDFYNDNDDDKSNQYVMPGDEDELSDNESVASNEHENRKGMPDVRICIMFFFMIIIILN